MSHYFIQNENNLALILIWIKQKKVLLFFKCQLKEMSISVFKLESNNKSSIIKTDMFITDMFIRKVTSGLSIIFFPR